MLTTQQAFWLGIIAILVTFVGPIIAVGLTIWYQNRHLKKEAQMNVFIDLISNRDQFPIDKRFVLALNRIEVIFHGNLPILRLWREYYDLTDQPSSNIQNQKIRLKQIELLTAIGLHLGYDKLPQVELQKYYIPTSHYNSYILTQDIQKELLRVLKSTETLFVLGKYEDDALQKDLREGKVFAKKMGGEPPEAPKD